MNRDIYDASMIYVSWMYVGDVLYVEDFLDIYSAYRYSLLLLLLFLLGDNFETSQQKKTSVFLFCSKITHKRLNNKIKPLLFIILLFVVISSFDDSQSFMCFCHNSLS